MKKRHIFASLIVSLVLVLSMGLTACGDTDNNGGNGGGNEQPQTVAVTSVELNKDEITLNINGTETLTATVKPDNATNKAVTWTSDKPDIATVNNSGKVTAKAQGTAIITATADGKNDTCTVTVNGTTDIPPDGDTTPVATITLNKDEITLNIGDEETLTATVKPDNATNKTVTWTSDKPAIVSVNNSGKVTAKADGTATITATADGKSDTCTVTVNKATETPPTNKYAEIVTALETEIGKTYTNPKVLIIYEYNGFLACVITTSNDTLYSIRTKVSTTDHSLTADIVDTKYFTDNITGTRLTPLGSFEKGVYFYGGTDDEKQMVESMITKLLGDGYTIMYGTISATSDKGIATNLGDAAGFTVSVLLEKGGSVFEYKITLTVSKLYGDVYQTVLNSTEANKDNRYRVESTTLTDLGEVAALYWAECNK